MPLDTADVRRLALLADQILPGEAGLPSGGEVLTEQLLSEALAARADLEPLVRSACDALEGGGDDAAAHLHGEHPEAFAATANLVAGAYFMSSQVRELLGYPGQVQNPAGIEEALDDLDGDLLDPVMLRGPIYRPTP